MKSAVKPEQYLTNGQGERVAVLLDMATYDRLREADEALAEIRAYELARPKVAREIKAGQFDTLSGYLSKRVARPGQ